MAPVNGRSRRDRASLANPVSVPAVAPISHSSSFDQRRRPEALRTAMATTFFWPTSVERKAAHLGHAALYALPALVIAAGWAETNFGGHAVQWFGVEMPRVFPETGEETLQDLAEDVHMWLAYAMQAVAAGHVVAIFKHRWFDGLDVIRRMTFRGG